MFATKAQCSQIDYHFLAAWQHIPHIDTSGESLIQSKVQLIDGQNLVRTIILTAVVSWRTQFHVDRLNHRDVFFQSEQRKQLSLVGKLVHAGKFVQFSQNLSEISLAFGIRWKRQLMCFVRQMHGIESITKWNVFWRRFFEWDIA